MYSIGIDIGGMSVKIGVIKGGEAIKIIALPTGSETEYDTFIRDVTEAVRRLISEAGYGPSMIGISSCGLIDSKKGRIIYSNNIKWENKNIVSDMEKCLQVPVRIANDAKCALLAEAVLGAGKEYDRVCMITLGTGVGGGFLTGKKLEDNNLYGDVSGVLGHMVIVADGRECTCGHRGCLETYASATAIMNSYYHRSGLKITAKEIFDRVRAGELVAVEVFEEFIKYLGDGLVSFGNILRPEIIVIGGGVASSADLFINRLENYVNKGIFGGGIIPIKIASATLGNAAGMIGATLL